MTRNKIIFWSFPIREPLSNQRAFNRVSWSAFGVFFLRGGSTPDLIFLVRVCTTSQPPHDRELYAVPSYVITLYLLLYSYVYLFYPTSPSTEVLEYLVCSNTRFPLPQPPGCGGMPTAFTPLALKTTVTHPSTNGAQHCLTSLIYGKRCVPMC